MTTDGGIDRIAPTRRPGGRPIMRQTWSELMFLHWPVPVAALRALVPPALEIDTFEGQAWVGLVPFTITRSRFPPLPPLPLLSGFHEVNVRTYVHHGGREPGVWFFSLDAASRVAVQGARAVYKLPYVYAAIELGREGAGAERVRYASRRGDGAGVLLRYGPTGPVRPAEPGTLEHFLAERYLLYAARGPRLYRARVHHAPYPLQEGAATVERETLLAAGGLPRPDAAPLAHYAAGVDVEIWPPERLP
jgi:uncharacterized protein